MAGTILALPNTKEMIRCQEGLRSREQTEKWMDMVFEEQLSCNTYYPGGYKRNHGIIFCIDQAMGI